MWLASHNLYNTRLIFPFFKNLIPDLGWSYVAFAVLVLVGATNAVNLTDGLDGLAISTFAVSAAAYTALAYVTGHAVLAQLPVARAVRARRRTDRCSAARSSAPASGSSGTTRIPRTSSWATSDRSRSAARWARSRSSSSRSCCCRSSAACSCMEAGSVIIQVASFKLTGQRVFKMAPIHHHFELIGWSEPKVIARFLIIAVIFALFSLTTLKLR